MCAYGCQRAIRISMHGVWILPWKMYTKNHENVLKSDFIIKIFSFFLWGQSLDILSVNYITFQFKCNDAFNPHTLINKITHIWWISTKIGPPEVLGNIESHFSFISSNDFDQQHQKLAQISLWTPFRKKK